MITLFYYKTWCIHCCMDMSGINMMHSFLDGHVWQMFLTISAVWPEYLVWYCPMRWYTIHVSEYGAKFVKFFKLCILPISIHWVSLYKQIVQITIPDLPITTIEPPGQFHIGLYDLYETLREPLGGLASHSLVVFS